MQTGNQNAERLAQCTSLSRILIPERHEYPLIGASADRRFVSREPQAIVPPSLYLEAQELSSILENCLAPILQALKIKITPESFEDTETSKNTCKEEEITLSTFTSKRDAIIAKATPAEAELSAQVNPATAALLTVITSLSARIGTLLVYKTISSPVATTLISFLKALKEFKKEDDQITHALQGLPGDAPRKPKDAHEIPQYKLLQKRLLNTNRLYLRVSALIEAINDIDHCSRISPESITQTQNRRAHVHQRIKEECELLSAMHADLRIANRELFAKMPAIIQLATESNLDANALFRLNPVAVQRSSKTSGLETGNPMSTECNLQPNPYQESSHTSIASGPETVTTISKMSTETKESDVKTTLSRLRERIPDLKLTVLGEESHWNFDPNGLRDNLEKQSALLRKSGLIILGSNGNTPGTATAHSKPLCINNHITKEAFSKLGIPSDYRSCLNLALAFGECSDLEVVASANEGEKSALKTALLRQLNIAANIMRIIRGQITSQTEELERKSPRMRAEQTTGNLNQIPCRWMQHALLASFNPISSRNNSEEFAKFVKEHNIQIGGMQQLPYGFQKKTIDSDLVDPLCLVARASKESSVTLIALCIVLAPLIILSTLITVVFSVIPNIISSLPQLCEAYKTGRSLQSLETTHSIQSSIRRALIGGLTEFNGPSPGKAKARRIAEEALAYITTEQLEKLKELRSRKISVLAALWNHTALLFIAIIIVLGIGLRGEGLGIALGIIITSELVWLICDLITALDEKLSITEEEYAKNLPSPAITSLFVETFVFYLLNSKLAAPYIAPDSKELAIDQILNSQEHMQQIDNMASDIASLLKFAALRDNSFRVCHKAGHHTQSFTSEHNFTNCFTAASMLLKCPIVGLTSVIAKAAGVENCTVHQCSDHILQHEIVAGEPDDNDASSSQDHETNTPIARSDHPLRITDSTMNSNPASNEQAPLITSAQPHNNVSRLSSLYSWIPSIVSR